MAKERLSRKERAIVESKKRISKLRNGGRYTTLEMAKAIGVTEWTIRSWIRNAQAYGLVWFTRQREKKKVFYLVEKRGGLKNV